ncbi:hypothetical protein PROFUN_00728 [Planoprotostelium fungivorum]|uniref:Uncharacterized protein n=1 Tax=Planoprotostelium fungivorum TaxID=1890364 RepID=A0A2P6NU65_9EUKA|nr:hypothetical protein PROFUN_00728 [Planoprotostelium fungivorum]
MEEIGQALEDLTLEKRLSDQEYVPVKYKYHVTKSKKTDHLKYDSPLATRSKRPPAGVFWSVSLYQTPNNDAIPGLPTITQYPQEAKSRESFLRIIAPLDSYNETMTLFLKPWFENQPLEFTNLSIHNNKYLYWDKKNNTWMAPLYSGNHKNYWINLFTIGDTTTPAEFVWDTVKKG